MHSPVIHLNEQQKTAVHYTKDPLHVWRGGDENKDYESSRERAMAYLGKLKEMFSCVLLAVAMVFSPGSGADVPPSQTAEVEHLITYLGDSDCRMIRNGKSHSGKNGAKHVRRKYDYFRDEVSSTEQFIEYAATRSTSSGRQYEVQCPGEDPVPSSEWLLDELEDYRSNHRG